MKGGNITKSGDILKEWLSENSEITLPEENRTKLLDLLKRLEKNDDQLREVKKMVIDMACEWIVKNNINYTTMDGYVIPAYDVAQGPRKAMEGKVFAKQWRARYET